MKHYKLSENRDSKDFKKEWSWIETKGAEIIIQEWLSENFPKIKESAEDFFGLPYTSSSSFALLGNTNTRFELEEGYNVKYFAITNNNQLIIGCWDAEENEIQFVID